MDQKPNYTDFSDNSNQPSLIGSSVRDSYDNLPTLGSLDKVKKPLIKDHESTAELIPVDEVRAEGALVADEEDELDEILDESGNIKENAIPDVVRLKPKSEPTRAPVYTNLHSDVAETYSKGEKTSLKLLGGAAEQYAVPASGVTSSYRHSSKHRKGSDFLPREAEYINPEQVRSVDDIINVVNKGDFEKASTLVDPKVAETIAGTRKLTLDELKLLNEQSLKNLEANADTSIPSSMLSREDSVALEEMQSRSESLARPSLTSENSFSRPNLARGESIHSGLNCDLAINTAFDAKTNAVVPERKPRHDPSNLTYGITNNSSMNYLRSISRSRSRARNDRKAFQGERLESVDLRQNGALINDDEMSNAPDIEYAVNKALDFVEDTHTVKNGNIISENGDIVKNLQRGLAEVAEEQGLTEEASNRRRINAFDALENTLDQEDELMKELMGDDDLADDDEHKNDDLKNVIEDEENLLTQRDVDETKVSEKNEIKGTTVDTEGAEDVEETREIGEVEEAGEVGETEKAGETETVDAEEEGDVGGEGEDGEAEKNSKAGEEEKTEENHDLSFDDQNLLVTNADEENSEERKISEKAKNQGADEQSTKKIFEDTDFVEQHGEKEEYSIAQEHEPETKFEKSIEESGVDKESVEQTNEMSESSDSVLVTRSKNENSVTEEVTESHNTDVTKEDAQVEPNCHLDSVQNCEESDIMEINSDSLDIEKNVEIDDNNDPFVVSKNLDNIGDISKASPIAEIEKDNTEALIAAAARESALQEENLGVGKDGSVYVPKAGKMTFEDEPVYLYTSFAGGFHVTTRTNRLETILAANRVKFEYRDLGTDEEAKKIWRRYSNGKTLPGIVRGKDDYIGNWEDIEEANEDYRVRSLIYETF
ncbi:hypothetical protein CANINC_004669 [Pichia inconspicua]|uniref:Uncharacterized protein n=1 Tax=Pichia inconspicua TaxID=52247 RepID=A0A4T0WX34_9ASCO|nr:hypothetical protein CANINC_004669 [[Candida] inconspicua]